MDAVSIDPLTWQLRNVDTNRLYTTQELDTLEHPACPACGAPAPVDRIAVGGTDRCLLGHWRCSHDPRHISAPQRPGPGIGIGIGIG